MKSCNVSSYSYYIGTCKGNNGKYYKNYTGTYRSDKFVQEGYISSYFQQKQKTMDETLEEEQRLFFVYRQRINLSDEASYENYLRMTKGQFKNILNLIENVITHVDTVMKN